MLLTDEERRMDGGEEEVELGTCSVLWAESNPVPLSLHPSALPLVCLISPLLSEFKPREWREGRGAKTVFPASATMKVVVGGGGGGGGNPPPPPPADILGRFFFPDRKGTVRNSSHL